MVLLEYHLHIPGPDPLTNLDSVRRKKYYAEWLEGTPTLFVNGKVVPGFGGGKQQGEEQFKTLRKAIEPILETASKADLHLSVDRKGDNITMNASIHDLKGNQAGAKPRLRFVLIEDVVSFAGHNGQRLHHHVVRAFPGGAAGFAVTTKEKEYTASVALSDLRDRLNDYLEAIGDGDVFPEYERPLKLKHLKVVALVQDDTTREILQAAQADVPE